MYSNLWGGVPLKQFVDFIKLVVSYEKEITVFLFFRRNYVTASNIDRNAYLFLWYLTYVLFYDDVHSNLYLNPSYLIGRHKNN